MQNYEISFDMLHNRIIIPHRYVDGKLIGIKTRYVNNEVASPIMVATNKPSSKLIVVIGVFNSKKYIKRVIAKRIKNAMIPLIKYGK